VKRKTTLKLTPQQKAVILGDPAMAPLNDKVALAKVELIHIKDYICPVQVVWNYVEGEMPDDEITVLIAVCGEDDAWLGFHDGDGWHPADNESKRVIVEAWAEVPLPPTPRLLRAKERGAS
jgi:hypothetical protein